MKHLINRAVETHVVRTEFASHACKRTVKPACIAMLRGQLALHGRLPTTEELFVDDLYLSG